MPATKSRLTLLLLQQELQLTMCAMGSRTLEPAGANSLLCPHTCKTHTALRMTLGARSLRLKSVR